MKRLQIYLEDDQYLRLKDISHGRDLARLIRKAIDQVYPQKDSKTFKKVLDDVAGIWKNRTDIEISRKGKKRKDYLASIWADLDGKKN